MILNLSYGLKVLELVVNGGLMITGLSKNHLLSLEVKTSCLSSYLGGLKINPCSWFGAYHLILRRNWMFWVWRHGIAGLWRRSDARCSYCLTLHRFPAKVSLFTPISNLKFETTISTHFGDIWSMRRCSASDACRSVSSNSSEPYTRSFSKVSASLFFAA